MDYEYPEKRKNKNDWKAKRRFNRYRQGGASRAANIQLSNQKRDKSKH